MPNKLIWRKRTFTEAISDIRNSRCFTFNAYGNYSSHQEAFELWFQVRFDGKILVWWLGRWVWCLPLALWWYIYFVGVELIMNCANLRAKKILIDLEKPDASRHKQDCYTAPITTAELDLIDRWRPRGLIWKRGHVGPTSFVDTSQWRKNWLLQKHLPTLYQNSPR